MLYVIRKYRAETHGCIWFCMLGIYRQRDTTEIKSYDTENRPYKIKGFAVSQIMILNFLNYAWVPLKEEE